MLSYRLISFLIAVVLPMGSHDVIASDDNPWSMDEPGEGQHSYYDLNGTSSGSFVGGNQGIGNKIAPHVPMKGDRANESTIRKTLPGGERKGWQSAPGKAHRDEIYGYAGPQSGPQAWPPITEQLPTARIGRGMEFGGKIFGAFPPTGERTKKRHMQKFPNIQGNVQGVQGQRAGAFANVLPPPIPDAAPSGRILPYPYVEYGREQGCGMRIAPNVCNGQLRTRGLNYGFRGGPTLSNPGIPPGVFGPGFMW
ncbi:MAG: hypothetical protein GY927_13975 [bacterium]|nr:hypothetical protein [bacterium]